MYFDADAGEIAGGSLRCNLKERLQWSLETLGLWRKVRVNKENGLGVAQQKFGTCSHICCCPLNMSLSLCLPTRLCFVQISLADHRSNAVGVLLSNNRAKGTFHVFRNGILQ